MHVLLELYQLTLFRIKQVSGSQMISDTVLLLNLLQLEHGLNLETLQVYRTFSSAYLLRNVG